ncbi:hypothetical protein LX12_003109 [Williamsia serinedens]|uniref:Uncharacterized protein n=2 Tax=Williamsia serinedens TaxID=391736 RepID=A0ABT1H3U4_9NOCA|nr:hypothetical protein [Williamsia serinedens]
MRWRFERTGRAGCYALALAHSHQIPVVLLVSGAGPLPESADAIGVVRYDPGVDGWRDTTLREAVALIGGHRRTDDANDHALFDIIL